MKTDKDSKLVPSTFFGSSTDDSLHLGMSLKKDGGQGQVDRDVRSSLIPCAKDELAAFSKQEVKTPSMCILDNI